MMPVAGFRVWAPEAERVEVYSGGLRLEMSPAGSGWWSAERADASHGTDYSFIVDGEGPFPDPRSPWQPEGVHGPSRLVDHSLFEWTDARWEQPPLESAVIYELHIGTFTPGGTFDEAAGRLGHISGMGFTHVEIMPVAEFEGRRGWGYDGVDLYAPHHAYGGPEGLKRLVDACHAEGLAVILDVVYNHLGPSGNYLGKFGPYLTGRYRTGWGDAVNLDGPGSDEVRRFFIDNALMWLRDYHFDCLRIDAVHAIVDMSAVHFLEQLATEVEALGRDTGRRPYLIAESDLNDPRIVQPPEIGGYGLDAQWNEDLHHALQAALSGERAGYYEDFGSISDIAAALTRGFVYDGRYSRFRGRSHGRPAEGLSGEDLVGFLQNHDQVGNRAGGERLSHLVQPGLARAGAVLVMASPFIPMVFQGEEWGASSPFLFFTDYADTKLGDAVESGRRRDMAAFGWDVEGMPCPQEEGTFLRSKLDWSETGGDPHRGMLEWYRELIGLRSRLPGLGTGPLDAVEVEFDEDRRWLLMRRGKVTVACNFAGESRRVGLGGGGGKSILLTSAKGFRIEDGELVLPPRSAAVLSSR